MKVRLDTPEEANRCDLTLNQVAISVDNTDSNNEITFTRSSVT